MTFEPGLGPIAELVAGREELYGRPAEGQVVVVKLRRPAKGRSPAEALRAAQLTLLAHNREAYGDSRPSTWGAFVLSGDWR